MTAADHRRHTLPYGYPAEIKDWIDGFIYLDASLQSNHHANIIKILTHRDVRKAVKSVLRQAKKSPGWPDNFTTFIDEAARTPERKPESFYTPRGVVGVLDSAIKHATELKKRIETEPDLFLFEDLPALMGQLDRFIEITKPQARSASDAEVGPSIGRSDGKTAPRNWIARQVGILCLVHLGEPHPAFTSAVTRALLEIRYGMTESNMRDLIPDPGKLTPDII